MKGRGCQDRHFPPCVQSLDIRRWIRLRIPQLFRPLEGLIKVFVLLKHFGQDIVRRPIDDPHHIGELIACQALLQRPDDRNTAGHCRLKEKVHTVFLRCRQQLAAMHRYQILVCRHHIFPGLQRPQDHGPGRLYASHDFDHNGDGRIIYNFLKIVRQQSRIHALSLFMDIVDKDSAYLHGCPCLVRQLVFPSHEELVHASSHCSKPKECCPDCLLCLHTFSPFFCFMG